MNILKNNLNKMLITTIVILLFLITISSLNAAERNITNTTSGGLNKSVVDANNDDTINLANGVYTNNVTNINIDKNLTIQGKDPKNTIIDAQKQGIIFNIQPNGTLTLINLTLTNGNSTTLGVMYNQGNLNITNCEFTNNNGISYGAIVSSGTGYCLINNCVFINNSGENGGAIYFSNANSLVINCDFINNTGTIGGAILSYSNNVTIMNCNFTNNYAVDGSAIFQRFANITIIGCNFINNTNVICIKSIDGTLNTGNSINYNRFLNNTGYDINIDNSNDNNADFNWWGSDNPDMEKIIGIILNNYFIMNVTNLTSLDSNGTVTFNYTFKLNTNEDANNSLLPYFTIEGYNNLTSGITISFDARFDNIFNISVPICGDILYTFVDDNEIQRLQGRVIIPEPIPSNIELNNPTGKNGETVNLTVKLTDKDGNPIAGKLIVFHIAGKRLTTVTDANGIAIVQYTIDEADFTEGKLTFTATFEGDENYLASNDTGIVTLIEEPEPPIPPEPEPTPVPPTPSPTPESEPTPTPEPSNGISNNPTAKAAVMKKTGIPINLILIMLLSLIGFGYYRKQ